MAAIVNSAIMDSAICIKKKLHWFILTQLDDGSHSEFCHAGFRHCYIGLGYLVIYSQINSKNTLTPFWLWLKLIQSDSNSFILTQLDDGSHIEFCHLGFSHLSSFSQTHSHLPRLVPNICTKKNFTHSFWLNLMMAAILNSAILDLAIMHKKNFTHSFWLNLMMAAILNSAMLESDTFILDSDTMLSSIRFTQKHSPSTLTLSQTSSIWLT